VYKTLGDQAKKIIRSGESRKCIAYNVRSSTKAIQI
jgi:hypothetical protein